MPPESPGQREAPEPAGSEASEASDLTAELQAQAHRVQLLEALRFKLPLKVGDHSAGFALSDQHHHVQLALVAKLIITGS